MKFYSFVALFNPMSFNPLSFDPRSLYTMSFDPVAFDPRSFDLMSVNPIFHGDYSIEEGLNLTKF